MKGILFRQNTARAIVNGTKTVTRRVMKPQPIYQKGILRWIKSPNRVDINMDDHADLAIPYARYHVGETVYIKEAYAHFGNTYHQGDAFASVRYSDGSVEKRAFTGDPPKQKWWNTGKPTNYMQNPRTMPAWAARHFITITDVRADRTKDITPEDCLKEGIIPASSGTPYTIYTWPASKDWYGNPQSAYFALYDSINGKDAHKTNWDWVYSFKRTEI